MTMCTPKTRGSLPVRPTATTTKRHPCQPAPPSPIRAPPLTTLIYWFDVGFLIAVAISYLIAVFLGTPDCEVGGLGELIRRLRGVPDPADHEAMWCIAGIHHLDQWEAERHRAKLG
jgi:hypothetical protein